MTPNSAANVDELTVTISLEIDKKVLSFSDLANLSLGQIVDFSRKAPEKVRILANGSYFADATLILVEDQIAVRIDHIEKA